MATIIETAEGQVEKTDVDPVTLDLIENGLRNARYEMDEVLFRTALSPGIREQHDEFPLIADPAIVHADFAMKMPMARSLCPTSALVVTSPLPKSSTRARLTKSS